jgi:hypothetical protein
MHECSRHPLYYIIKDRGVGLMLASPSTSVKATSLKEYVPLVGSVCDLFAMMVVNILLLELGPIPPLFSRITILFLLQKNATFLTFNSIQIPNPHMCTLKDYLKKEQCILD